uniref:Uncharacterized protein n=1 Tax=Rhodnius prolixus TaxID=13249 RepID=T1HXH6_RHOPR
MDMYLQVIGAYPSRQLNQVGSCSNWPPPLEMHRHALSCQLSLTDKEIDSALTELQTPFSSNSDIDSVKMRNFDSLIWHSETDDGNSSNKLTTCRNSVQGKSLMVDDKGVSKCLGEYNR